MPDETIVWKTGVRVRRREDVFDDRSKWMHGMIVGRRFHERDRRYVYKVQWDDKPLDALRPDEYFWWGIEADVARELVANG